MKKNLDNTVFCLRNLDLYEGISEKDLIHTAPEAIEESVPAGTLFYDPDSPAEHVYVIKQGEVELYRKDGEKKVVLETLLPGDVFGDFGLGNTNHAAKAARNAYICKTPTGEFLSIVRAHPEIALRLMQVMAQRNQDYENRITSLSRPAKDQLLDFLRHLQKKHNQSLFGKMFRMPLRISHQKIAEKTGLNRVTVTKLMGELRRDGLVVIEERTGVITVN